VQVCKGRQAGKVQVVVWEACSVVRRPMVAVCSVVCVNVW